jgi:transcription initiation factor TFIIB
LEKWKSVKIADSIEKNLVLALQFITEIAVDLSLPRIALRNASMMYQKMVEKGLIRGRSMKAMSAAAVYLGCRQCGIATTIKEIAHVSKISPEKISRSCRSVIRQLNLSLHPSGASDLALKMATRLHLPTRTIQFAEKTLKALNSSRLLLGKDPAGIAAAVIYTSSLLTGERKTQREIAEVGRITEATIRTRCRELEKNLVVVLHL